MWLAYFGVSRRFTNERKRKGPAAHSQDKNGMPATLNYPHDL